MSTSALMEHVAQRQSAEAERRSSRQECAFQSERIRNVILAQIGWFWRYRGDLEHLHDGARASVSFVESALFRPPAFFVRFWGRHEGPTSRWPNVAVSAVPAASGCAGGLKPPSLQSPPRNPKQRSVSTARFPRSPKKMAGNLGNWFVTLSAFDWSRSTCVPILRFMWYAT
eukprot:scaffold47_cov258-Pinguiococcus_pyrenoidosus.AAC.29